MSKALDKSINKAPAKLCLSGQNFHLSTSVNKAYCILKPFLYPHKNGEIKFPIYSEICFCIIRSNNLETVSKALSGLQFSTKILSFF